MLRVPCTLLTQQGLRINSRAFSSSRKLALTHEFCGRGLLKGRVADNSYI